MIKCMKVVKTDKPVDLDVVYTYANSLGKELHWRVFEIEYSGEMYNNMLPGDVEKMSLQGIYFTNNEFSAFIKTINQVIEGTFVCMEPSQYENLVISKNQENALLGVHFYHGSVWEVGGMLASKFAGFSGLKRYED